MVIGIIIIAINSRVRNYYAASQVGGYILLAGLFGLFCGAISTIGILLLVYKVPLIIGSGYEGLIPSIFVRLYFSKNVQGVLPSTHRD